MEGEVFWLRCQPILLLLDSAFQQSSACRPKSIPNNGRVSSTNPRAKTDYQGSMPALNTNSRCPRSTPKSPSVFRQCILVSSIEYHETVPGDDRYSRGWWGPAPNTPSAPQIHLPLTRDDFYLGDTKHPQSLLEMTEEFEQAVDLTDLTLREPLTASLPHLSAEISSAPSNAMYSSEFPDELWSPANITEYNTGAWW